MNDTMPSQSNSTKWAKPWCWIKKRYKDAIIAISLATALLGLWTAYISYKTTNIERDNRIEAQRNLENQFSIQIKQAEQKIAELQKALDETKSNEAIHNLITSRRKEFQLLITAERLDLEKYNRYYKDHENDTIYPCLSEAAKNISKWEELNEGKKVIDSLKKVLQAEILLENTIAIGVERGILKEFPKEKTNITSTNPPRPIYRFCDEKTWWTTFQDLPDLPLFDEAYPLKQK